MQRRPAEGMEAVRPRRFWARPGTIQDALDLNHLTHRQFADHLGLSRGFWSQVFNRVRPLSPMVRQCLLASKYLAGIDEVDLWDVEAR